MSDIGSDGEEHDDVGSERRAPTEVPEVDGWGTAEGMDRAYTSPVTAIERESVEDGWADAHAGMGPGRVVHSRAAAGRAGPASSVGWIEDATVVSHDATDTVADQAAAGPPDMTAGRDAAQAALLAGADLPPGTGETSEFQRRVAGSEAHDAKSLAAAEEFAREHVGVARADLSGFDQRTANEVNATLDVLYDKYPDVGRTEFLGTLSARNSAIRSEQPKLALERPDLVAEGADGTVAMTLTGSDGFDGIAVNDRWAGDYEQSQAACYFDEFSGGSASGTGSISGVTAHEFGHLVEAHLRDSNTFADIEAEVRAVALLGLDRVTTEVSDYANHGEAELFAEAFAEYQLSDRPRRVARHIGQLVDKQFGGSFRSGT